MLDLLRRNRVLILSLFLFVLLGAIFSPSAGRDDDYIAFWAADSLVETGEIVNYNGERIEQGSSIGHILVLTAASGISGLPAPKISVPMSVLSGVLLLLLLSRFKAFFDPKTINLALLLTASSFPFVYWCFSGLETSIYTLSLTLFCFVVIKTAQSSIGVQQFSSLSLVILALQMLRPEAFFVLGLLLGLFWILGVARELRSDLGVIAQVGSLINSGVTRFFLTALGINFLAFGLLVAFRYFYFDAFFPQPVTSKLTGVFPGLQSGFSILPGGNYIFEFFTRNFALAGAILTGAVIASFNIVLRNRSKYSGHQYVSADVLIAVSLSQFVFILLAGPDWMEGFRFIVPIVPVLSLMAALAYHELCEKSRFIEKPLIAILMGIQAFGLTSFIANESASAPLWATRNNIIEEIAGAENYSWFARANTCHLRDIPVAEALKNTVRELRPVIGDRPVVVMSYQAGLVLYHVAKEHFGDIQFIDSAGLADDTITRCMPLREETQRLRDEAARKYRLGHLAVARYLIEESDKPGTCFSPRPDIVYMVGNDRELSPLFDELGYKLAFNNAGSMSLRFGKTSFYGGYLVDKELFEKAGLEFKQPDISITY